MARVPFATTPFGLNTYGEVSHTKFVANSNSTGEGQEFESLRIHLNLLRDGDFKQRHNLLTLMQSRSRDIRLYATQLFADTATHKDVEEFSIAAMDTIADAGELRLKLISIAYTLSPYGAVRLAELYKDFNGLNDDGLVLDSLSIIINEDIVDNAEMNGTLDTLCIDSEISQLDPALYYCRGNPIDVSAICDELIHGVEYALSSGKAFGLSSHPRILSNFYGAQCPIDYGTIVNKNTESDIILYTTKILSQFWENGTKYFFGRKLV